MNPRKALVVGASGIAGSNLARALVAQGWDVAGLARRPRDEVPGVIPVAADLMDPASLASALMAWRPPMSSLLPGCATLPRRKISVSMAPWCATCSMRSRRRKACSTWHL